MDLLFQVAKHWLQPNTRSATEVVEHVVMDKFLRELPNGGYGGMVGVQTPRYLTIALETAMATKEIGAVEVRSFRPHWLNQQKASGAWQMPLSGPDP